MGTVTLNLNKNNGTDKKQNLSSKPSNNEQLRISNNSAFSNIYPPNIASVSLGDQSNIPPYRTSMNLNTEKKSTSGYSIYPHQTTDDDYNNLLDEKTQTNNSQDLKTTTKQVKQQQNKQQSGLDLNASNYDTLKNTAKRNYWMSNRKKLNDELIFHR